MLGFLVRRLDFVFLYIRALTCRLTLLLYCLLSISMTLVAEVIPCTKTMAGATGTCWMGIDGAHSPEMGTSDGSGRSVGSSDDLMRVVWDSGTKTSSTSIHTWLLFQNMPK